MLIIRLNSVRAEQVRLENTITLERNMWSLQGKMKHNSDQCVNAAGSFIVFFLSFTVNVVLQRGDVRGADAVVLHIKRDRPILHHTHNWVSEKAASPYYFYYYYYYYCCCCCCCCCDIWQMKQRGRREALWKRVAVLRFSKKHDLHTGCSALAPDRNLTVRHTYKS